MSRCVLWTARVYKLLLHIYNIHWRLTLLLFLGVATETLFRCRDDSTSVTFAFKQCPHGQVVSVQSADVGYDPNWDPNTNPPTCSQQSADCRRSIEDKVMRCNGQRSCRFDQTIFTYPSLGLYGSSCPQWTSGLGRLGNIVSIEYSCIGKWKHIQCPGK